MLVRYVILYNRGRNQADSTEAWRQHVAQMRQLYAEGRVLMGGPFPKGSRYVGMAVIEADSMDQIHAILAHDPAIAGEYAVPEIFPWALVLDRIADAHDRGGEL